MRCSLSLESPYKEKLLDQVISDDAYKMHNDKLSRQLSEKRQERADLNHNQKDLSDYIDIGVRTGKPQSTI
jgi:hypothetical protein